MIFGPNSRMRDDSTLTAEPFVAPVQAVAPESPSSQIWTARRAAVLVIAYFAALATLVLTRGVHISSDRYFLILLVPAVALGLTRQYLRDWVPFIALMIAYEFARGGAEWLNADILGRGPFYAPMIDVDRALFFGVDAARVRAGAGSGPATCGGSTGSSARSTRCTSSCRRRCCS